MFFLANSKYIFLKAIFFSAALYFLVFYFFIFTFSPKKTPLKTNLQFLGSILSQHDVQAKYYAHPNVNHSQSKKQILEIRGSNTLKSNAQNFYPEKPLLANQIKPRKKKGTPQARTTPLPKTSALAEPIPQQNNTEPYVPLKLPDENHY